jgi:hypothetical protein
MQRRKQGGVNTTNLGPTRTLCERGAVLIQVTVAIVGLIAFTIFVIDYGVVWVGRAQAQNAADAAAMAGAVSLAYDTPAEDAARARAIEIAALNPVWGEGPIVLPGDVQVPTNCPDGTPTCVKVDVYRDGSAGHSPDLPSFFGRLLNINSQRVRATATAQAGIANASECLKPWAIPDKWHEQYPDPAAVQIPWSDSYEFDAYDQHGNPLVSPPADYYVPATRPGATGYTIENDYGTRLTLKAGNPASAIAPGWFLPVCLPRADGCNCGGNCYRENIASCNAVRTGIDDYIPNEPGNMIGPTAQGVRDLIALDPNARWDGTGITGSQYTGTTSPRLVALPVFDVSVYAAGRASGRQDIQIINILGFFIEDLVGNDVRGVITHYPGTFDPGAQTPNPNAAFQRVILLVQ